MTVLDVVPTTVLLEPTPSKRTTSFNTTIVTSATLSASSTNLNSSWDQVLLEKLVIAGLIISGTILMFALVVGVILYLRRRQRQTRQSNEIGDDRQGRPPLPPRSRRVYEMEEIIERRQELPVPISELSEGPLQRAELDIPEWWLPNRR
jgi:hypothetical protein